MKCQETSGFLTLHQCENQATRKCHYCKKRICDEHARPIEDLAGAAVASESETQAGTAPMPQGAAQMPGMENDLSGYEGPVACIACMKKHFAGPSARGINNTRTSWFRNRYYYDPYFYGGYYGYYPYGIHRDYDRDDYNTFNEGEDGDYDDLEDS